MKATFSKRPYFVVWFKISWHISCANWGLSEVKFLKYSSLIMLRLIDWFINLVILLLIHVMFAPDIDGITWCLTGSVVTRINIIIANDQKIFIFKLWINGPICQMEQIIGTLIRGKFLLYFVRMQLGIYFFKKIVYSYWLLNKCVYNFLFGVFPKLLVIYCKSSH